MKYRKRPVLVDAEQWLGTKESWQRIHDLDPTGQICSAYETGEQKLMITTPAGNLTAMPRDWVVRYGSGEIDVYPDGAFVALHEPA